MYLKHNFPHINIKYLVVAIAIMFSIQICLAQQKSIKISVVDSSNVPLDYFNVLVLNPSDSAYITGEVFYNGNLNYNTNLNGKKVFQIKSLGYRDCFLDVDLDSLIYPDKIIVEMDVLKIGEVVVYGRRTAVKMDKGKTILQVAGSSLGSLFDITNIMNRAPGVKASDDGISVLGRGKPQIYIDGRMVTYSELKALQPSDIFSIEIDRNPSARYDASAKAVIRVKTKRVSQGVSGRVNAGVDIARMTSPTAGGKLQINTPKLYTFLGLDFSTPWYNSTDDFHQSITLPNYSMRDSTFTDSRDKYIFINFLYNSIFKISEKSKLSWQYHLDYRKINTGQNVNEIIDSSDDLLESVRSSIAKVTKDPIHKFNVGYQIDFDTINKLEIFGDYTLSNSRDNQLIEQKDINTQNLTNIYINNNSSADVATLRSEYTTKLSKSDFLLGASYGYINSRTNTDYNGKLYNTKITSGSLALYATFGKEYKKWGYELGLRYEYLNDKLLLTDGTPINRTESRLFPSANIHTNQLWKDLDINFSYASRTSRPSINSLNPTKSYLTKVTVGQGNPNLLSAVYHNIALNFTLWSKLSLDLEYNIAFNSNLQTGTLSDNGKMIIFMPVNLPRASYFTAMLSYSNEWKWFSLSANTMLFVPNYRIPYMNGYFDNNIVSYEFKVSPGFKISKNTNLFVNYTYTSRTAQLMSVYEPSQDLSVNFSQFLFKRKVQIVCSLSDILRKYDSPWRDKMGYYECYDYLNRDARRFEISIRYFLNKFKNQYKGYKESDQNRRVR